MRAIKDFLSSILNIIFKDGIEKENILWFNEKDISQAAILLWFICGTAEEWDVPFTISNSLDKHITTYISCRLLILFYKYWASVLITWSHM